MSLPRLGKVYLGVNAPDTTSRFPTDPKIQRAWPPRRSRLQGIQGSVMQQDFGRWAADLRLTLSSQGNFIDNDFKTYLDELQLERLGVFKYEDYQGVTADVIIADFAPIATFLGDADAYRGGGGVLYEYALALDVVRLYQLDFVSYLGH